MHYYPLASGDNRIGSERGNGVILAVRGVSREHALLCLGSDGLTIEDLGSKNGTRVGNTRVTAPSPLADGDELTFGSVVVTFRAWAADPTLTEGGA